MKTYAIILSAGQGRRMGSSIPKQYLPLGEKPVLAYSLQTFGGCSFVDSIILVAGKEDLAYCEKDIVERFAIPKVQAYIPGGRERFDSVWEGLQQVSKLCRDKQEEAYVMIHDGARPLIDAASIKRSLECAIKHGACAVGMPSKDTVKICREDDSVRDTPDRRTVWQVQTPQTFRFDIVYSAYEKLRSGSGEGITDDAMVVERMLGRPVYMSEGTYSNLKITTPEDLDIAGCLMKNRRKDG